MRLLDFATTNEGLRALRMDYAMGFGAGLYYQQALALKREFNEGDLGQLQWVTRRLFALPEATLMAYNGSGIDYRRGYGVHANPLREGAPLRSYSVGRSNAHADLWPFTPPEKHLIDGAGLEQVSREWKIALVVFDQLHRTATRSLTVFADGLGVEASFFGVELNQEGHGSDDAWMQMGEMPALDDRDPNTLIDTIVPVTHGVLTLTLVPPDSAPVLVMQRTDGVWDVTPIPVDRRVIVTGGTAFETILADVRRIRPHIASQIPQIPPRPFFVASTRGMGHVSQTLHFWPRAEHEVKPNVTFEDLRLGEHRKREPLVALPTAQSAK